MRPRLHALLDDPVRAEQPQPLGQLVVLGGDEAALAGRHRLHRVQGEHRHVGPRRTADRPPVAAPAERVAGVLDHVDAARAQLLERLEVDRQPGEGDRDDGTGPASPAASAAAARVEVPGRGIDVHEAQAWPPDVERAVGVGRERERRGDRPRRPARRPLRTPRRAARRCRSRTRRRARRRGRSAIASSKRSIVGPWVISSPRSACGHGLDVRLGDLLAAVREERLRHTATFTSAAISRSASTSSHSVFVSLE